MDILTCLLFSCVASLGWGSLSVNSNKFYNVVDYGALGDGTTDDSQAFLKAWGEFCSDVGDYPTLIIPAGKTFLLSPISFKGPCKPSNIHVQVLGKLVASTNFSAFKADHWLTFIKLNGLVIDGSGEIDGQGKVWWDNNCLVNPKKGCTNDPAPTALLFHDCINLRLTGLKHTNSQRNHISINKSNGVKFSDLTITAPGDSPNTDGIDISSSTDILIQNSYIGTGDDCVAINGGTSIVNISWVHCGPGHGISIGSLGKDGAHDTVEQIYVQHCNLSETQNGARIKTWQGGSGYARGILFENIQFSSVKNPITIDQYYCPRSECKNQTSAVQISDVRYSGIYGTSMNEVAVNLACSETLGCTGILMENVKIESADPQKLTSSYCINAHGTASGDCAPKIPCLASG